MWVRRSKYPILIYFYYLRNLCWTPCRHSSPWCGCHKNGQRFPLGHHVSAPATNQHDAVYPSWINGYSTMANNAKQYYYFFFKWIQCKDNWANVHMKQAKLPLPLRYFQCHYTCFVWLSVPKLGHPHLSPSPISLSSDFTEHYYYTHTVVCSLAPLCLLPHTSAVLLCQLLYIIRLRLVSNKGLYSFVYSAMCLK